MQKNLYPCLWVQNDIQEVAHFYLSVFENSILLSQNSMVVLLELKQTKWMILSGGTQVPTPAVSFVLECDTQKEIDTYWQSLGGEGTYQMCGWLTDKYGISWQVIPKILGTLMSDTQKAPRVMEALMRMQKIDIDALLRAS